MYERSKHFFQGNQFKNSHNLFSSQCMDIIRSRNLGGGGGGLLSGSVWFWNFYGISSGNTCR